MCLCALVKKYNLDVQLQVAITDLVKEGMPNNPLEYVGGKLQGMGQASQLQAMGKPTLHYFDVSGRGELCKLIAAVGGVELDIVEYPFQANGASVADKLKAGDMESEHTKAATAIGMEGCGLPIVVHGDLKINQSFACQNCTAPDCPSSPPTALGHASCIRVLCFHRLRVYRSELPQNHRAAAGAHAAAI